MGGGTCGDLAMILHEILIVKGYNSRTIQLIRQVGSSFDTHIVIEVWGENLKKFILLDPTFNLMFKSDGNYISASELKSIVLYEKKNLYIVENIQLKVAQYKEYYVNYFSLYNNILIVKSNNLIGYKKILSKLPILHNYLGRKYYVKDNDSLKGILVLYNIFYFYIPIFLLINIFLLIFFKIIKRNN